MVIVTATRFDLRDEYVMADDVFALSPISARAVQPSEADYDAIRDAFMETSRGRWFLGEYAKRNRNADTSMVLDAVARIEEALAAQRQGPAPDDRLFEVLAAVRDSVDRATEAASAAFDSATLDASLAPIRKGIVIIKEISWRWREIGADGRICDLIDSQLDAIEAGCGQIAAIDPHAALSASFELIRTTLAEFIEDEVAAQPVEDVDAAPASDLMTRPGQRLDGAIGADDIAAEPMEPEQPAPEVIATGHAQAAVDGATFSEQDTIDGDVEEEVIEAVIRAPDMPAEGAAAEAAALAPRPRLRRSRPKPLEPTRKPMLMTRRCWNWSRPRWLHPIRSTSTIIPIRSPTTSSSPCGRASPSSASRSRRRPNRPPRRCGHRSSSPSRKPPQRRRSRPRRSSHADLPSLLRSSPRSARRLSPTESCSPPSRRPTIPWRRSGA
jgi:hypothetical protein